MSYYQQIAQVLHLVTLPPPIRTVVNPLPARQGSEL